MHGIDLSNNNRDPVDWTDVHFAFLKTSESITFVDKTYGHWAGEAIAAGAEYGPYHFAHPDVNAAAKEAAYFLARTAATPLGWALDIETRTNANPLQAMGANALAAWCDDFFTRVAPTMGVGYFYTFRSYAQTLYPLLKQPWLFWLSSMKGAPTYTEYANRPIAIEQYNIVNGVDQNEMYATTPPPIPSTGEDLKVLHLIVGDKNGAWWLTDWITKRYINSPDEAAAIIVSTVKSGGKIEQNGVNGPVVYAQAIVDRVPVVGPHP